MAEATSLRRELESSIRRRDRRRIIREWALHRQDGIFGTDRQPMTILKLGCIISRRQIRSAQKNARRLITPFPRRKPRDLRRRKLLAIAEGIMDTTILRTYSLIAGAAMILIVALPLILIIQAARRINYHGAEIREAGKKIAGNTVSIRMLQTILRRSAGRSISRHLTVARISQSPSPPIILTRQARQNYRWSLDRKDSGSRGAQTQPGLKVISIIGLRYLSHDTNECASQFVATVVRH
jgi:hypothetical protein